MADYYHSIYFIYITQKQQNSYCLDIYRKNLAYKDYYENSYIQN